MKRKTSLGQNDITSMRTQGVDLSSRWKAILEDISKKNSFDPDWKSVRKSEWWKTGKVGAISIRGRMRINKKEESVVLKIQGTKPVTSEALMIKAFEKQNKSKVIRPTKIYAHFPWSEDHKYEALIVESVAGKPVIVGHPATEAQLERFFDLYEEYRKNCRRVPWVDKPKSFSYRNQVSEWLEAVKENALNDPLKEKEDQKLMEKGVEIIEKNLKPLDLEFVHGHFDSGDLIVTTMGEVILFSNLFWSWRIPFYDAVFGYHWWMLGMEHASGLSEQIVEKERRRWLEKIYNLKEIRTSKINRRLVTLALLERAIPALMVDRYVMDQSKLSAEIITKAARKELLRLIRELS